MGKRRPSKKKSPYEHYFFLISIILLGLILFFMFENSFEKSEENYDCGDGSFNGFCSEIKPYYCYNAVLLENASFCGCSKNLIEKEESCFSEYKNNPMEIKLKYFIRGEEKEINFTVYKDMADYLETISREINYFGEDTPSRGDFKLKKLNEVNQNQLLMPLVVQIQNIAKDKEEQMRIAVSIIQNIEWGFSNKTSSFGNNKLNYSRYPYEVLHDSQGVCGEKSELLAFLLRELGFDTALFYNQFENHESLGIKCPEKYSWEGSGYCFVETTGPSIITDTSIEYIGGLRLSSKPEIIFISDGISLGDDLYEYKDAKDLMRIREKMRETGKINFFDIKKLEKLNEKYGLVDDYNIG